MVEWWSSTPLPAALPCSSCKQTMSGRWCAISRVMSERRYSQSSTAMLTDGNCSTVHSMSASRLYLAKAG